MACAVTRIPLAVPLAAAACWALPTACADAAEADADRNAILSLYEAQREAHFQRDARMFLSAVDTGYLAIGSGTVRYRAREEAIRQVDGYFQQVEIEELRDVTPPRVTLSPDGRFAWLVGEVEVRGSQHDSVGSRAPIAFRAAWLDVYEKEPSGWRLRARANTQNP